MHVPYIILIIAVVLLIIATILYQHAPSYKAGYFIAPMIIGIFGVAGAMLSSLMMPVTFEEVPIEVNIANTPRMVIVDDGHKSWQFEMYSDVKNINDSTQFFHVCGYNLYGGRTEIKLKYVNK
jgi:hypothetical protein